MSPSPASRSITSTAKYIALLLLSVGIAALPICAQNARTPQKRLLGYYPSWGIDNTPPYTHDDVPYSKLTHISHAFALLTAAANGDIDTDGMIDPILLKKAHAAGVKVLLSIGGGGGNQGTLFNKMSASETARQNFVGNVYNLLTKYGYDGVDIDWEVPNAPDRANCTTLIQELRDELPSPWLISMAVTADPENYGVGLDIPALAPIVDFFNVMTYDFYGTWSGATGHVSPLFQSSADPEQAGSTKTSMDLYETTYGVPIKKLNIGTPFYGYEWVGTDQLWGQCTGCPSYSWNYATYIEDRINQLGWTRNFDDVAVAPYLTNPDIAGVGLPGFITFDGASTTARKTTYVIKERHFGGMFMWELSADWDGHRQELFDALYEAWK
jgi:chitinase